MPALPRILSQLTPAHSSSCRSFPETHLTSVCSFLNMCRTCFIAHPTQSHQPDSFPATSEFGLYRTNPFSKFLNVNSLPLPLKETIFPRVFCSSYICSISVSLFTLLVTYQLSLKFSIQHSLDSHNGYGSSRASYCCTLIAFKNSDYLLNHLFRCSTYLG